MANDAFGLQSQSYEIRAWSQEWKGRAEGPLSPSLSNPMRKTILLLDAAESIAEYLGDLAVGS